MRVHRIGIQPKILHNSDKRKDGATKRPWLQNGRDQDGEPFVVEIGEVSDACAAGLPDQNMQITLRLIETLVQQTTGRHVKLAVSMTGQGAKSAPEMSKEMSPVQPRDSWGLIYEYQETAADNERVRYSFGGTVTATGGRVTSFALEFTMPQAYDREESGILRPVLPIDAAFDPGRNMTALRVFDLKKGVWIDETDPLGELTIQTTPKGEKTLVRLGNLGVGTMTLQEGGLTRWDAQDFGLSGHSGYRNQEAGKARCFDLSL